MPNRLESVDPTVLKVLSHLEGIAADATLTRIRICLSEALCNLVIHARTEDPSEPIVIVLTKDGPGIGVEIFDPVGAEPFDLLSHARNLSEVDVMAENGRGLGLIVECADSVAYGPSDGRNRLALGFDRRDGCRPSGPPN